ncbi:MAG TPA: DSD1 family PLP-dependent enzyme [Kofleriaceae bacterium]|nr:DSD1 family PLP-dependent enzyme [Kofleriaceae bacterium]
MTDDLRLHGSLIGRAARDRLATPALVIDRDALDRNLARMAEFARAHGTALRPHAKTHKSADLARRQLAAGAAGVCCAKLGEAEALADGGIPRLLITSPVVAEPAIRRLVELHRRCDELMVVVDHPANAGALAAAASAPGAGRPLDVLIDIDPGIHRTGVASPAAALELAQRIRGLPQLRYRGIQFYCGMQQHIARFADRDAAIRERMQYLQSVIALLSEHQVAPAIVTGAGTGTHRIDAALGRYTEWQVGSYVFMDRQYAECELTGDGAAPFDYALFVETTVVSANHRGMATIDAGFKALATDGGPPAIVSGAPAGASYRFLGDEHGAIVDPAGAHVWQLGDRVRLAVPHCDPTVNLYDSYHVVSGDTLEAIWPVTARGRSR